MPIMTTTITIITMVTDTKSGGYDYIRDPAAIEAESFRRIRAACGELTHFDEDQRQVAMRLVHTCGDPALLEDLRFAGDLGPCRRALDEGRPLLVDVEMVRHGLARRYFQSEVHCYLNAHDVPARAKALGETRSMAALTHWRPLLQESIVVIGNAPTALFRLLEMLDDGAPRPALIVGMPVGFVGAAESKQALLDAAQRHELNLVTLRGYRGGSALAASAVNALARRNHGIQF